MKQTALGCLFKHKYASAIEHTSSIQGLHDLALQALFPTCPLYRRGNIHSPYILGTFYFAALTHAVFSI